MRIVMIAVALALLPCTQSSPSMTSRGPFRGYLAKVRAGGAADTVANAARQRMGTSWEVEPTGLPQTVLIHPGLDELSRTPATTRAAVDAWEVSHILRATGIFEWIEPAFGGPATLLEAATPPVHGECEANWQADWGKVDPDEEAAEDSQWSLGKERGANVINAWKRFSANQEPGTGILIGHTDTGYTMHPSITDARLTTGFSFVERRADAQDLTEAGNLQWPGHGTRTSSVIAGKHDYRVDDKSKYPISGVAYGAKLIPLRVTNRVLLFQAVDFDMLNLAMAIHAASIGDPNFVPRRVDIISMSLGGAPNHAIVDALETARRHNVIVLAAAGNDVPFREVGFPARYEGVNAIAAVNARSDPWKGSSKGSSVAFAAPGENVWTAKEFLEKREVIDDGKKHQVEIPHHCVEMGTGTSYAVATSAGVAALWLSKNQAALRGNQNLSATFRKAVQETVRTSDKWKKDYMAYGPGIVNADNLLAQTPQAPLVQLPPTCTELRSLQSVFGEQYPGAAAMLVSGAPTEAACVAGFGVADEIAHWFATEPSTLAAFETFFESVDRSAAMTTLRQKLIRGPLSPFSRRALGRVSESAAWTN